MSTLIVVHCYAGDEHQVRDFMPQYKWHDEPVLILSPEDAPVEIDGVDCRSAGKRCYIGRDALERQIEHLNLMSQYPADWFLLHDSDSVCITPTIPSYLYEDENVLWANRMDTHYFIAPLGASPQELEDFHYSYQPPVFFSRDVLHRMLAVADLAIEDVPPYAQMIDYLFTAMAHRAGVPARPFHGSWSYPIWDEHGIEAALRMIDSGTRMIHSVKRRDYLDRLLHEGNIS